MAPAESFKLAILRNPSGIAISDVSYVEASGRRRPVFLGKVGDVIDLGLIDIGQYIRSMKQGVIRDLARSGVLVPVQQELPEKRMDLLNAALAVANAPKPQQLVNVGTPGHVMMLEPGLQVAIGDGTLQPQGPMSQAPVTVLEPGMAIADNPHGTPDPAPAMAQAAEALEAGAAPLAISQQGVTLDSMEQAQAADAAKAAEQQAKTVTSEPVTDWKAGKNLKDQEDFLLASTDVKFLQALIDDPNEESARLKNVAKKRLADLASAPKGA